MTPLEFALDYIARGWNPVPIPLRSKKPTDNAWQKRLIDATAAPQLFNGGALNIGVQLGPNSHGLTDVDLDFDEAVVIGPYLLPATRSIFGRPSKRASHRLYYTDLGATHDNAALQFRAPGGEMIVELRMGGGEKGAQTIFPGSVHKETGECITWDEDGEPARADGIDLLAKIKLVAAASLIARSWPAKGGRHDAARGLGGLLVRAGFSEQQIKLVAQAIARAAGDEEWKDRVTAARDAAREYHDGGHAYGMPNLIEVIGEPAAKKVAEWLDYDARAERDDQPEPSGGQEGGGLLSDDAIALLFAERHAGDWRYVAAWAQWMSFDRTHWRRDDTLHACDLVRVICRELAIEGSAPANVVASAKTVAAVERLAKADRRLAATSVQWDANEWALNTGNDDRQENDQ
jgi:hypothetical protein